MTGTTAIASLALKFKSLGIDTDELDVLVRFLKHQATERDTCRFATRKRIGHLERVFTWEQHLPQDTAKFFL